jgi:hypothetical protein
MRLLCATFEICGLFSVFSAFLDRTTTQLSLQAPARAFPYPYVQKFDEARQHQSNLTPTSFLWIHSHKLSIEVQ